MTRIGSIRKASTRPAVVASRPPHTRADAVDLRPARIAPLIWIPNDVAFPRHGRDKPGHDDRACWIHKPAFNGLPTRDWRAKSSAVKASRMTPSEEARPQLSVPVVN